MEAKYKLVEQNERMYWLNNKALHIQCVTRRHQARAVREGLRKEQAAVFKADEHYMPSAMLAMTPISDAPKVQCYTLRHVGANEVEFSAVLQVNDDVSMMPVSMDTRGLSDPEMEMRTAYLIQAVYRGHRVRVKMQLTEVETVARLQQRAQELEVAGIGYENRSELSIEGCGRRGCNQGEGGDCFP